MMSLADAILQEDIQAVRQVLRYGEDINQIDEYGFTPLIEAAIVDNIEISTYLLSQGADPNKQDVTGGTALQWAVENNNQSLCQLLLKYRANPNAYNFAGQPVLVMPTLRQQAELRQLLITAGADQVFAQDYINTKLLGHMFELVGTADIVDPQNQFVDVDFEGFYLEVTIGLISESLSQFQNHFAARQLRRYAGLSQFIVEIMQRSSQLIKYQQYRVDISKYQTQIDAYVRQEPVLIPVGYEGHAITFIKRGDIWVKCDRREDSRLYDNVMFYRIHNKINVKPGFIKNLIYKKQSDSFINNDLDDLLGLEPITELKVEAQVSGNCSWANVEASIPAIFFLVLMETSHDAQAVSYYKTLALNYFHRWREWNKDRALHYCIQSYKEGDAIRKACKAEILAAILFQRCDFHNPADRERIELILSVLLKSPYEYILQNYLRVYYFENYTEEGKRFSALLKEYGYKMK
ncbi:MAG: ankyrin repeat domain-containing protein [Gammaproteobacteria bacterium]|nr:ankyrin repeat domain-containing protein [Gammaproteobacteria bacterium]MCW5583051.1 ankyrin repeat domain-containing protein [Gammaproteobacteria bacterium]